MGWDGEGMGWGGNGRESERKTRKTAERIYVKKNYVHVNSIKMSCEARNSCFFFRFLNSFLHPSFYRKYVRLILWRD